jgi:hypothetical protein
MELCVWVGKAAAELPHSNSPDDFSFSVKSSGLLA